MPFIGSVRGSFGAQGRFNRRILPLQLGAGTTGGSISTGGGYRIHTFDDNQTTNFVPQLTGTAEVYIYGASGGSGITSGWGQWGSSGGGGFAGGTVEFTAGRTYIVKVGQGGRAGGDQFTNIGVAAAVVNGGGAPGANWGCGGGGGLSGVFDNNSYSQANALLVAGGGGGGGSSRSGGSGDSSANRGGAGGGTNGQDGTANFDPEWRGRGGLQNSSQNTNGGGNDALAPGALQGGTPNPHGPGGGGGYWGGSGGGYQEPNTMGGGGGGSGYFNGALVSVPILTQGNLTTAANTGGIYYSGSYGNGRNSAQTTVGQGGRVVIRYLV